MSQALQRSSSGYISNWFWADSYFKTKTVSLAADRYTLLSPSTTQVGINGQSLLSTVQQSLDLSSDNTWDTNNNALEWQADTEYSVGDVVRPTAAWLADGANNASINYATPVMLSDTLPYGTVSYNSRNTLGAYYGYKAFNQDVVTSETYWRSIDNTFPCWLQYDFGLFPKVINKFRWRGYTNRSPYNWVLQGSNASSPGTAGDSADWTLLYTGVDTDIDSEWTEYYAFSNSTAYRHYRMYITQGNPSNPTLLYLHELQLVSTPSLVYCCTQAGTSGSTQPAFPATEGSTVGGDNGTPQWTAYLDNTNARNRAGQDFFIYACTPVSGTTPTLICSKQSTYPLGYTATNSRKIGGFHCLCDHMSVPSSWKGGVVNTVAVGAGGTGYTVGDVLTITGGNNDAKATVAAVSSGVVTALTLDVYNTGTGYSAGTLATTGGTGNSDCTITVTIKARVLGETVTPSATAISATPALADYWYRCITAGTSHATTEPTWNQVVDASPAADGTVTWICEAKHSLAGYVAGDILPQSVWDLRWKSGATSNNGQVYDPSINKWVGIYLPSISGTVYSHTFGGTIADTITWNGSVDAGASLNMRLARDSEFQSFSEGSNQKTTIYGAADPVTVTGAVDTSGRRCVSNIGVEGCVGVAQQWLDEQSYQFKNAAAHYHKVPGSGTVSGNSETLTSGNAVASDGTTAQDLAPAWGWSTGVTKYRGQIYGQDSTTNFGDVKVCAGGGYNTTNTPATDCGSRCRVLDKPRWTTAADISFRLVAKHIQKEFI